MTAALLNAIELARRLNGRCAITKRGSIISRDGREHADCSTCEAQCGIGEMGMAGDDFSIVGTTQGAKLKWRCPGCGVIVTETTRAIEAHAHADRIKQDPLCHKCRPQPDPTTP